MPVFAQKKCTPFGTNSICRRLSYNIRVLYKHPHAKLCLSSERTKHLELIVMNFGNYILVLKFVIIIKITKNNKKNPNLLNSAFKYV